MKKMVEDDEERDEDHVTNLGFSENVNFWMEKLVFGRNDQRCKHMLKSGVIFIIKFCQGSSLH